MSRYILEELANISNFNETAYLSANPDVANAIKERRIESGLIHFRQFGQNEGRKLRKELSTILDVKIKKLDKIKPLLKKDMPCIRREYYYDYLTDDLRQQFNIVDTNSVSVNSYDGHVMSFVEKHDNGFILDCGAGKCSAYFDNIVNFEIVPYDTTDVCGVGEKLPFKDNSFDGVISMSVLEHVKDPFQCAGEIIRVLKPGGDLICSVPFLQPYHGYPHHYYNMSYQGLRNLFDKSLSIDEVKVYDVVLPIWSLTWILRSWSEGLTGNTKDEFLNLKVSDLINPAQSYLDKAFVKNLIKEKNFELASATVLFAHK